MGTCSARSTGRGEQARVGGPPHGQALVSEKSALEPPGLGRPELLPADGGHSGARGTLGPSPAQDWGFLGPGLEFPHAATPHPGLSQREPSQPAPVPAAAVSARPPGPADPHGPSCWQPRGGQGQRPALCSGGAEAWGTRSGARGRGQGAAHGHEPCVPRDPADGFPPGQGWAGASAGHGCTHQHTRAHTPVHTHTHSPHTLIPRVHTRHTLARFGGAGVHSAAPASPPAGLSAHRL